MAQNRSEGEQAPTYEEMRAYLVERYGEQAVANVGVFESVGRKNGKATALQEQRVAGEVLARAFGTDNGKGERG